MTAKRKRGQTPKSAHRDFKSYHSRVNSYHDRVNSAINVNTGVLLRRDTLLAMLYDVDLQVWREVDRNLDIHIDILLTDIELCL